MYDALACQCLDENTKRVRIVAWSSKRENEGFPRKWMDDRIEYEFEGHYFWGPQDSDGFLKFIYGNYMKLPPIDQRITHSPATYVRLLVCIYCCMVTSLSYSPATYVRLLDGT